MCVNECGVGKWRHESALCLLMGCFDEYCTRLTQHNGRGATRWLYDCNSGPSADNHIYTICTMCLMSFLWPVRSIEKWIIKSFSGLMAAPEIAAYTYTYTESHNCMHFDISLMAKGSHCVHDFIGYFLWGT